MILGNIIIGTVSAEQQIKFVRNKELKKLWALLNKGRLDEAAETEMIERFAGLEDFIKAYLQKYKEVEAAILLPENRNFLFPFLGYGGRFQHHENEFRFLTGYEIYPQQAGEYLAKFGKELVLTEDEWKKLLVYLLKQKAWNFVGAYLEKYGNAILKFDQLDEYFHVWLACPQYRDRYLVSKEVEAAFLLPENRDVLLQFLGNMGRFQHHENEFRFLTGYEIYPQEVDKYLEKFGKDLNLTEKEWRQLFSQNPKAIRYVDITSNLVLFKEFALPEIRRQRLPVLEDDFSLLVKLSWDYPDWLRDYLKKHSYLEPEQEAELFFCADTQIRLEYGQNFGFDVENLIEQAPRFGIESRIVSALKKEMVFVREYISRELVLRFNLHWIKFGRYKRFSGYCDLCKMLRGYSYGDQFYADNERYFSRNVLKDSSYYEESPHFCRFWECPCRIDQRLFNGSLSYRLIETLRKVRLLLEHAAERHYLTA